MKNLTLDNIARACDGELFGGETALQEASCVVIDSRKMMENGVFIATKGERVDGHDFIPRVKEMGALGVVCERVPEDCDIPYILVRDSFQALKDIAEYYRKGLSIPIIGITGSVGKTSTKEMIAAVLSQGFHTLKTDKNYNNEIGLPLTVLQIMPEHEAAVLEMGISDFGEMHRLSKVARPDICVLTNIGQCHLENLGSREGILKAKSEIFDFMNPEGQIFVNGDDDMLIKVKGQAGHVPVRFGLGNDNQVYASDIANRGLLGSKAVIHMGEENFQAESPLPGIHMVVNALAAAAVGKYLGLSTEKIQKGITEVKAVEGRSRVVSTASYTMIDDCYNANPVSMKAAIDLLTMAVGRKVAVLGDMFELGDREKELHGEVGAYVVEKDIDVLLCAGELCRSMYEQACTVKEAKTGEMNPTEIYYFADRETLLRELGNVLKEGDNILVKASHGMQFEKVVSYLEQS